MPDAFTGGVSLGDEFGREFLEDFRARRVVEERDVSHSDVRLGRWRDGRSFGVAVL